MIKFDLNRDNLTFIGLVIVVLLLLGQCSRNATLNQKIDDITTELNASNANVAAANDTVEVYKNRKGFLEAEIKAYQISADGLKKANAKLVKDYATALSLNKNLKNVNALLRAELKDKDSLLAQGAIMPDSTFILIDNQDYGDENYRNIKVAGKIQDSTVTGTITIDQSIRLWMAVEDIKGVKSLKLSTKYPFNSFDIQGIDLVNKDLNTYQKKSRWTVSAGVGLGIVPNGTTGLAVTPTVGIILGWSPKWLQF
jgi:hypothetical protein